MKAGRAAAVLAALALASCHAAAPPPPRKPAVLTEQWQTVPIESLLTCTDRLACLVAGSGPDRPTTVTIKKVSFARLKRDPRCIPKTIYPGLTGSNMDFGTFVIFTDLHGASPACPVFMPPTSGRIYEPWQRGLNSFEAQDDIPAYFLPVGSVDTDHGRDVRCLLVVDTSQQGFLPSDNLQAAAETCIVLYHFRDRSGGMS